MSIKTLIAAVGLAAALQAGAAAQFIGGDVTLHGIDRDDDLVIAAGDVSLSGRIGGDLRGFGGDFTVNADVGQDVRLVGGSITFEGTVAGDVEMAAGNIEFNANVGGDADLAGGFVNVRGRIEGETAVGAGAIEFGRDFVGAGRVEAGGEEITFQGTSLGSVEFHASEVIIDGRIEGDLETRARELILRDGAVVTGRIHHRGPNPPEIRSAAVVSGEVEHEIARFDSDWEDFHDLDLDLDFAPIGPIISVGFIASAFLLGILACMIAPRGTARIAREFRDRPLVSGMIGLVLFAFSPVILVTLIVLLCITLIGIPLAGFVAVLYFPLLFLAYAFGAMAVGDLIFNRRGKPAGLGLRALSMLVVLIAAAAMGVVPLLGVTAGLILMCIGLGAWVMALGKKDPQPVETAV
ncbi:hypothetical protein [Hyphobacterium marinum]|uniref:DUF8173 domain-containing protein n=1 Tax=Hyphobacterium marinum TaxID=3116574 RepID=A0ABU7LZZ2_9PROT|nr:hypothetical protein [Hyphobacterium sp. Y6023]MEE2566580.1 hypothetical protein [Hyphobacterium sp. Y6023]